MHKVLGDAKADGNAGPTQGPAMKRIDLACSAAWFGVPLAFWALVLWAVTR